MHKTNDDGLCRMLPQGDSFCTHGTSIHHARNSNAPDPIQYVGYKYHTLLRTLRRGNQDYF